MEVEIKWGDKNYINVVTRQTTCEAKAKTTFGLSFAGGFSFSFASYEAKAKTKMVVGLSQFRLASPPKGGEFESHYRLSLMVFATRGVTIPCQGYDPSTKKKKNKDWR